MKSTYISLIFLICGLLGFVSQILYASYFGTSFEMGLYYSLLSIPSIITGLSGTLFNSVFIPDLADKEKSSQKPYIGSMYKNIRFLAVLLTTLIFVFLIIYTHILTKNCSELYLTGMLLSILLSINLYFALINGFMSSVLNYNHYYLTVAASHLIVYLSNVFFVIIFGNLIGVVAIGIGLGGSAILQFFLFHRLFKQFISEINIKQLSLFKSLFVKAIYIACSLIPFTAFSSIAYFWASRTDYSSVSFLGYSHSFSGFLSIVASMGVATVTFPNIAQALRSFDKNKIYNTMKSFERTTTFVLQLIMIVCCFLTFNCSDFIDIFLQRGNFDLESVKGLGNILPFYLFGGGIISILNLVRNIFYSDNSQKTLCYIGGVITIVFFLSSMLFNDGVSYITIAVVENALLLTMLLVTLIILHKKYNIFGFVFYCRILIQIIFFSLIAYFISTKLSFNNLNDMVAFMIKGLLYCLFIILFLFYVMKDNELKKIVSRIKNK